jgi:PKD repeat protein
MAQQLISIDLPAPGDTRAAGAQKVNVALQALAGATNGLITIASGKAIPPTAVFTAVPAGLTVTVNAGDSVAPNGSLTDYAWTFGDNSTGTGVTTSHTYTAAGTYTVGLNVTDNLGRHGTVTHTVTVNAAPVARFTATPTGLTVSMDGTASSDAGGTISAYAWKFGDGGIATGATASHAYTAAGSYTITLTVTDNSGLTGTVSQLVTVTAPSTPVAGTGDAGGTGVQPSGTGIVALQNLSGADLTAKLAAAGANIVSLPPSTSQFTDFGYGSGNSSQGLKIPSTLKGIRGAGSKYSILQMAPRSSTKGGTVPSSGTNQLQYLYLVNPASGFLVDGVTMLGTEQGHLYNGFFIQGAKNLTVSNCSFVHVPGNGGSPPGETFGINLYAQEDTTATVNFTNVTVDGQKVGAAGLGTNRTRGIINLTNVIAKNMGYSAGIALWEVASTSTINIRNSVMTGNHRNLGLEAHGGTVNVYDPVWGDFASGGHDVNLTYGIASGATWKNGVLNFYFTDAAAWQKFLTNRANKKIAIVTNWRQDYGSGIIAAGSFTDLYAACRVYIGGVKQNSTDYISFTGNHS